MKIMRSNNCKDDNVIILAFRNEGKNGIVGIPIDKSYTSFPYDDSLCSAWRKEVFKEIYPLEATNETTMEKI